MCLLFETVKVQNRRLHNIEAHNRRVADSRRIVFGFKDILDLQDNISIPDDLDNGLYKCRVVYDRTVLNVEFQKYMPRRIRTLRLVYDDTIRYEHKYLDRSCFQQLLQSAQADDILLVQHGYITDVSFANIVFSVGNSWITPAKPLFHGIKRQILLQNEVIHEEDIMDKDLDRFTHAALINAMLDLTDAPLIPTANILLPR
jgi:4-amino-4-deoxychorismate lyase